MDVRCDRCGTEYELEDHKITSASVAVKCTSCGHVFRVSRSQPPPPLPPTRPAAPAAPEAEEWRLRQASGEVFSFRDMTTLQRWIVERKVGRSDEISKGGLTWRPLGDIADLSPFFAVLDAQPAPVSRPSSANLSSWAPEPGGGSDDELDFPPKRSSRWPWLIVAGLVVLVAAGLGVFRDRWSGLLQGTASPEVQQHLRAAQAAARKDTYAGFAYASAEYDRVLESSPDNLAAAAGKTEVEAAWGAYLSEEAQDLEAKIKNAGNGAAPLPTSTVAELATHLAQKKGEAVLHFDRSAIAAKTLKTNQELSAKEALLFAAAVQHDHTAFTELISQFDRAGQVDDDKILLARGIFRTLDSTQLQNAAADLQRVVDRDAEALAGRYRLALALLALKDTARAKAQLTEVVRRAPDHPRAAVLLAELTPASAPADLPAPASAPASAPQNKDANKAMNFDQLIAKAHSLREREHTSQALEMYNRALTSKPGDAEALSGRGFCYLDLDQTGAALQSFQEALASNSRFIDAVMGMAEAYRAKGQKRDAVKYYQKYLDLAPDGPEAEVARNALKELGQSP